MTDKLPPGIEAKGGRFWVTHKRKHVGTFASLEKAIAKREAMKNASPETEKEPE